MAITTTYKAIADLDTGAARMNIVQPLATYDDSAHVFAVEIRRGSSAEELSGTTCIGYFVRADGVTIPIDGDVKGNVATVILAANCYAVAGGFALAVKLSMGNVVHTVLRATGNVSVSQTDEMASPGTGVQSFDKLVEAAEKAEGYDARITETEKTVDTLVEEVRQRDRVQNLLDDSWFANPVAQAGQNGMHGSNKYVCDRWISLDKDATFANGYMTPGSPVDQRIDPNMISQTKTYTVAICLSDGTIKAASGTFASGIGSYALGVLCAGTTVPYVRINTGTAVRWAALYEGTYTAETLPAYVYKGYAAELVECQRYYQVVPGLTHIPGVTNSATSFGAKYQIQPMRIAPTVAIPSGGRTSIYTGDYSATTEKYTLQYAAQPNQLTLNVDLTAGSFVAYKPGMLVFPVDITLSADL